MTHDAVKSKIRWLLIRSGVAEYHPLTDKNLSGRRRNDVKASHGFRKFFSNWIGKSRLDVEIQELLMGHKIGLRARYLKYSTEDKLNEYLRAVDNLTIDAANRLQKEVDEYKKQEREIASLKKEILEIKQQIQTPQMKPHGMEPPTMKEIVGKTGRPKDKYRYIAIPADAEVTDFERNLKGVSKEILKKVKR